jgi:hypothetical protein
MPRTALLLRLPLLPHVLFVPVDGGERDVELSGGFAGADEVEGGGDGRGLGMGADGAPGHLRVSIARRDVCMSEGFEGFKSRPGFGVREVSPEPQ